MLTSLHRRDQRLFHREPELLGNKYKNRKNVSEVTSSTERIGFTIIELLVVIGIIGVLVALLLPSVQSAREAGRKAYCSNNVRQLALATALHHDALGYYPPARYQARPDSVQANKCGLATPTWLARVMPFIEQSAYGERWDFSKVWYRHEEDLLTAVPDIYLCPSRRSGQNSVGVRNLAQASGRAPCGCPIPPRPPLVVRGALCDYSGNHGDLTPGATGDATDFYYGGNGTGVIISVRPKCLDGRAIDAFDRIQMARVSDGTSNTFLMGEKFVPPSQLKQYPFDVPAYDGDHLPASCRLAGPGLRLATSPEDIMADMFSFGSWHPGGVYFAMVDGSVRFLNSRTDTKILGMLANRHDAQMAELTQ